VTTNAEGLRAAAALGPYFAVDLTADEPGWLQLATLVEDPALLRERVAVARQLLADRCGLEPAAVDERATASIYFLGLAARLVSPAFGAAVLTGTVPIVDLADVHWQPVDGGPIPIAMTGNQSRTAGTRDGLAELLYSQVVATAVAPVSLAVQREFRLSPKVVWGNVTSAIAGAATMIGLARPESASMATQLAARVLATGPLVGMGRYVHADPARPEQQFARNNCCLFYRIPGGGICADCVLVRLSA